MNCIWLLLIFFCCGNNHCGCNNSTWNNNCNRCDRCDNRDNNRRSRENTCESVCETVCEAARDAVNENSDQGCGCRRTFPFTSYPVLDNCD